MNPNKTTDLASTSLPTHCDILGNIVAATNSLDFKRFLESDSHPVTNDKPSKLNSDFYDLFAQTLIGFSQEDDEKTNTDSDTQVDYHANRDTGGKVNEERDGEWIQEPQEPQDLAQEFQEDTGNTVATASSKPFLKPDKAPPRAQGTPAATVLDAFTNANEYYAAAKPMHTINSVATAANPYKSFRDDIPLSLRKPFKIPFATNTSVITPQTKNQRSQPGNSPPVTMIKITTNGAPTLPHLNVETDLLPQAPITTSTVNTGETNSTDNIYNSPYISQSLKPRNEDLVLSEELEPLRPLILSQHEAFSQSIKDLGKINLTFTKTIEQKKESYDSLKTHKKTPRSLCIRCELTASPSYSSNSKFKLLKE